MAAIRDFVSFVMGLASKRRRAKPRVDEEQTAAVPSVTMPRTLGGYPQYPPPSQVQPPGPPAGPPSHLAANNERLALFRLMLGITTTPDLGGFRDNSRPAARPTARPADNIGLYARVVNAERKAKSNYKVFSTIISACYFLQIIVAASLTAMGAASADNKAITAFGAINTIIAGLLTYLKGSGLPARLKYYGGEWKKIRELIELRERDFAHPDGCALDVYDVVEGIRDMYNHTKRDIEMNTPDGYNSVTAGMRSAGSGGGIGIAVDSAKADQVAGKLRSLDETLRSLKSRVEKTVHHVQDAAPETYDSISSHVRSTAASKAEHVAGKLRSLDDRVRELRGHVEKTANDVHSALHTAQAEEKRVAEEVRNVGEAVVEKTAHDVADVHRALHTVQAEGGRVAEDVRSVGEAVGKVAEAHSSHRDPGLS